MKCGKWIDQQDTSMGESPQQEINPRRPEHRMGAPELRELMERRSFNQKFPSVV